MDETIEPPSSSSKEMYALYKEINKEFGKVSERNKCQDDKIDKLNQGINMMTERMNLVLARIDADREGREATLIIAVKAGMREISEETQKNNDDRFLRQSAEVNGKLDSLKSIVENFQLELQQKDIDISGRPTRKEFDKYVSESDEKIGKYIENRRWSIGTLVAMISGAGGLLAAIAAWLAIPKGHP
jgi:hypothetical protein